MTANVLFTREPGAIEPTRAYPGDAGWDLYSTQETVIPPLGARDIPTGVKAAFPADFWAHIVSRSSTFRKYGVVVIDAVIDNGYRGELYIQAVNPGANHVIIPRLSRIAQVIFHQIHRVKWTEVDSLPSSDRGDRGFGSSGI